MYKKLLITILTIGWLNAGLINGVAVTVNNKVITLYDIDQIMQLKKLTQSQAVSMLIDKILYEQEIKKFALKIKEADINTYIENLAKSNNMSVKDFKSAILKQKKDYKLFKEDIRVRVLNQKLIEKVALGKLQIATEEDITMFYDNNIDKFKVNSNSIEIIPLTDVKNKIFSIIMNQREQKYLKEYFETLKITADIVIVR